MRKPEITLPGNIFWSLWLFLEIVVSGIAALIILLAVGAFSVVHLFIAWGIIIVSRKVLSLKWRVS